MTTILKAGDTKDERRRIHHEPASFWMVVMGAGLALSVVGWVDVALLWYPLRFGDVDWEFGTVTAHLDGMPLGTVGLTMMAAASIARDRTHLTRALAVCCLLVTLWLLLIGGIYLLNLPLVLQTLRRGAISQALGKATIKAGVFALTYMVLYAWLTWVLWRSRAASS